MKIENLATLQFVSFAKLLAMNQSASLNAYDLNLSDVLAKKVHDNPASACREAAHDRNRGKRKIETGMRAISHEQSLRSYFEFFDKDNSGTIEMKVKRFLPKLFMNNPGTVPEVEAAFGSWIKTTTATSYSASSPSRRSARPNPEPRGRDPRESLRLGGLHVPGARASVAAQGGLPKRPPLER